MIARTIPICQKKNAGPIKTWKCYKRPCFAVPNFPGRLTLVGLYPRTTGLAVSFVMAPCLKSPHHFLDGLNLVSSVDWDSWKQLTKVFSGLWNFLLLRNATNLITFSGFASRSAHNRAIQYQHFELQTLFKLCMPMEPYSWYKTSYLHWWIFPAEAIWSQRDRPSIGIKTEERRTLDGSQLPPTICEIAHHFPLNEEGHQCHAPLFNEAKFRMKESTCPPLSRRWNWRKNLPCRFLLKNPTSFGHDKLSVSPSSFS